MGRTLDEVIASLPARERKQIEARYKELVQEINSLRDLRKDARLSQEAIAKNLGISQPAVSKMERQADMSLSTLRSYIEAIGGTLDLIIRMPGKPPVHLELLGDLREQDEEVDA